MADPLTPALVVGGVASSAAGSAAQNSAMRRQNENVRRTAAANRANAEVSAANQRARVSSNVNRFRAAATATAAARGISGSRSIDAIRRSATFAGQRDIGAIQTQLQMSRDSINSTAIAQQRQVDRFAPLLAGVQGGLAGYQMGLGFLQANQSMDLTQMQIDALGGGT